MRTDCLLTAVLVMASRTLVAAPSPDLRDAWKGEPSSLANAVGPGAGFSFTYEGKVVGPKLSDEWSRIDTQSVASDITRAVLRHGSGLVVTHEVRRWPDFAAVEYRVRFKNF